MTTKEKVLNVYPNATVVREGVLIPGRGYFIFDRESGFTGWVHKGRNGAWRMAWKKMNHIMLVKFER